MIPDGFKPRAHRWLRFLLGGGLNTGVTYGIYLALNLVMAYQVAYFIAYVFGVAFAYWFNAVLVFRVSLSWKGLFSYPLVYLVQYVVSALLLGILVEFAHLSEQLAPLLVVICLIPVTYILSKSVLDWSAAGNSNIKR